MPPSDWLSVVDPTDPAHALIYAAGLRAGYDLRRAQEGGPDEHAAADWACTVRQVRRTNERADARRAWDRRNRLPEAPSGSAGVTGAPSHGLGTPVVGERAEWP